MMYIIIEYSISRENVYERKENDGNTGSTLMNYDT